MKREGAVLRWEDYTTEWEKDWIAEQEATGEGFDLPCPTCGEGTVNRSPEKAAYEAWCDYASQFEWDYFTEELTQLLDAMNPDGNFHVEGHNMGWLHREGYKDVFLHRRDAGARGQDRGSAFLCAISPRTECMYWIWAINENGEEFNPWAVPGDVCPYPPTSLVISLAEHDGTASYDVTPLKEEEEEDDV
jgi:hypothetical protein